MVIDKIYITTAVFFLLCFFGVGKQLLYAQQESSFEEILESVAQESEVSPVLDAIDYFASHPLVLHTATPKELMLIPGFSSTTARAILRIVKNTSALTYDSLQQALDLSREQMDILRLCTSLANNTQTFFGAYRIRMRQHFPTPLGIANNRFVGSPLDLYQRLVLITPFAKASATLQKDAGELSLADFLSANIHLAFANTDIVLGDYVVQSGMGTLLWQQFGARKGPDVLSPATAITSTIRPYRSSIEQNFFRGIALQREFSVADSSVLTTALWYSTQQRAATLDTAGTAVSLDADGYFRTTTEQQHRNTLGEQAAGGTVEWKNNVLAIGSSLLGLYYSHPIESNAQTAFIGKEGILASVYGTANYGAFQLACEAARDARGALGLRAGLYHNGTPLRYAFAFRTFANNFRSPFGHSFGESSHPTNETGLYAAVEWRMSTAQRLRLYTDIYRTGGPIFSVPTLVRGLDIFAEYNLQLSKATALMLRLHREDKTDALTHSDNIRTVYQRIRTDVRCDISHTLSHQLQTRFRCQIAHVSFQQQQPEEIGITMVADIHWKTHNSITIASHAALFSTHSFSSALWVYEPSVAGIMSAPALFGEGVRGVFRLAYTPAKPLTLWFHTTVTAKNHVDELGSGVAAIPDNTDYQVQVQIDYTW